MDKRPTLCRKTKWNVKRFTDYSSLLLPFDVCCVVGRYLSFARCIACIIMSMLKQRYWASSKKGCRVVLVSVMHEIVFWFFRLAFFCFKVERTRAIMRCGVSWKSFARCQPRNETSMQRRTIIAQLIPLPGEDYTFRSVMIVLFDVVM